MTIDWVQTVRSRSVRVDAVAGVVIAIVSIAPTNLLGGLGLFGSDFANLDFARPNLVVVLLGLVAIIIRRIVPGGALGLAWLTAVAEIGIGERPSPIALAYVLVLYASARVGSRGIVLAGALSAVVGGAVASYYLALTGARFAESLHGSLAQGVLTAVAPAALLGSAWLLGLAVRFFFSRADEAQLRVVAETRAHDALDVAAEERARAAEERARAAMTRDVHDIVGHSLAVIIAQADSIEFLDDTDKIRAVGLTIAQTARSSLGEVRHVLNGTGSGGDEAGPQDLGELVEQVRAAGVVVEHSVRGERRTLDAARAVVVRRVAQEMLTNALRHGQPGRPIVFRELWRSGDVVLEAENGVADGSAADGSTERERVASASGGGLGIAGMRSRVAAVGGFVEAEALDGVFTARARIPVLPAEATGSPAAPPRTASTTTTAPSPSTAHTNDIAETRREAP